MIFKVTVNEEDNYIKTTIKLINRLCYRDTISQGGLTEAIDA